MAKKPRHEPRSDTAKPQPPPTFRPLEEKLKALAEAAKAEAKAKAQAKPKAEQPRKAAAAPGAPRPSTLTADERRDLSAMERARAGDDELTFHRMMSGVVPLDSDTRGRLTGTGDVRKRVQKPEVAVVARAEDEARARLDRLVDGGSRFLVRDDGRTIEGRRAEVDPRVLRKLQRGELPVDGRLDLRGKQGDQARTLVEAFVLQARARRERALELRLGEEDERGPLRGEVAAWLSHGRAGHEVTAFVSSEPDDAGHSAALLVLLRT
jgi:DNA-nicking Smr family endonuclease